MSTVLFFLLFLLSFSPVSATPPSPPQPHLPSDFEVAAYYMPKVPSLTREWTAIYKWNQQVNSQPKYWPYLGLYSTTNPEVINWQIKWALEHGLSTFIFDWFNQPLAEKPNWNQSLDTFLTASFNPQMKFAIYWTALRLFVTGPDSIDQDQSYRFISDTANYWYDHYLTKSNYLKTNGSPIIFLDHGPGHPFQKLVPTPLNGCQTAGYACGLSIIRRQLQSRGLNSIVFVGSKGDSAIGLNSTPDQINQIAGSVTNGRAQGLSAFTSYGYYFNQNHQPCSQYPSQSKSLFQSLIQLANTTGLDFIPSFSSFFNPDSLNYSSDPMTCDPPNSPLSQIFKSALSETKGLIVNSSTGVFKVNNRPLITISAWNEWGEGSVIEPGIRPGNENNDPFAFLKSISTVFNGTSYTPPTYSLPQNSSINTPNPLGYNPDPQSTFLFNNQSEADKWFVRGAEATALVTHNNQFSQSYSSGKLINNAVFNNLVKSSFYLLRGTYLNSFEFDKVRISLKTLCPTQPNSFNLPFTTPCPPSYINFSWVSSITTGRYLNGPFTGSTSTNLPSSPNSSGFYQFEINLSNLPDWQGNIQEIQIIIPNTNYPLALNIEKVEFTRKPTPSISPTPPPPTEPQPTNTGIPDPTDTPPPPTNTGIPDPTDTPPVPTNTSIPDPTDTPTPNNSCTPCSPNQISKITSSGTYSCTSDTNIVDFVLWRQNYQAINQNPATPITKDYNCDHQLNVIDFFQWRTTYLQANH